MIWTILTGIVIIISQLFIISAIARMQRLNDERWSRFFAQFYHNYRDLAYIKLTEAEEKSGKILSFGHTFEVMHYLHSTFCFFKDGTKIYEHNNKLEMMLYIAWCLQKEKFNPLKSKTD